MSVTMHAAGVTREPARLAICSNASASCGGRASVFFVHEQACRPRGKLRRVRVTNGCGVVTVRAYDEADRPRFTW